MLEVEADKHKWRSQRAQQSPANRQRQQLHVFLWSALTRSKENSNNNRKDKEKDGGGVTAQCILQHLSPLQPSLLTISLNIMQTPEPLRSAL